MRLSVLCPLVRLLATVLGTSSALLSPVFASCQHSYITRIQCFTPQLIFLHNRMLLILKGIPLVPGASFRIVILATSTYPRLTCRDCTSIQGHKARLLHIYTCKRNSCFISKRIVLVVRHIEVLIVAGRLSNDTIWGGFVTNLAGAPHTGNLLLHSNLHAQHI